MDVATTALTNAWLQAVWRVQYARDQQPQIAQDERTMTDVMERALRAGGPDSNEPQWDPSRPGSRVDRLV